MKMLKTVLSLMFISLSFVSFSSYAADASGSITGVLPQKGEVYFTVRPDVRRCISPICGGWFVNAVNRKQMRCLDGSIKKECYVGTDVINIPGLSAEQIAELKQAMSKSNVLIQGGISNNVPYGVLHINNAWISATDQKPEFAFVGVSNNGIVCITSPCPSFDGDILNRNRVKSLASFDLSGVKATEEKLNQAQKVIASGDSLPMAGKFVEVTGPGGTAQGIKANQFYLKVESSAPKFCRPTGCSGQICSDSDVITTCEWKPEYQCYRSATCSAQANGDCGWVMDDELRKCLEDAAGTSLLQQFNTN